MVYNSNCKFTKLSELLIDITKLEKERRKNMFPNLRAEMARRGLTVEDLAGLSGIKYSTLSQKLNGSRPLSFAETLKIKEALDVTIPLEVLFDEKAVL